jgi:hypothetical protein
MASATKIQPSVPNSKRAIFEVLDLLKMNHTRYFSLEDIEQELDNMYSTKVLRTALVNLMGLDYLEKVSREKNKHYYRIKNDSVWDEDDLEAYDIFIILMLNELGKSLGDYGTLDKSLDERLSGFGSNKHRQIEAQVMKLIGVALPFVQKPDESSREILMKLILNAGLLMDIQLKDGNKLSLRLGKVLMRRGGIYLACYGENDVIGLYLNEVMEVSPILGSVRMDVPRHVEQGIANLHSSAYDGASLDPANQKIVLEVHPDHAQALIWGRPKSDDVDLDGIAQDGWLRFTQYDDIRQELVDLLAGMAGRVRIIGPVGLCELVADRIREIAGTEN